MTADWEQIPITVTTTQSVAYCSLCHRTIRAGCAPECPNYVEPEVVAAFERHLAGRPRPGDRVLLATPIGKGRGRLVPRLEQG